jgi:predicted metalloendopeptidase
MIAVACWLAWTAAAPVQARDMTPEQIRAVKADGTDASVLPGNDFNRYANGVWMKQAVIEPSKAATGVFDALAEESDHAVKKIIQKSMLAQAGTAERKPGDFYTAYADVKTINQLGMTPVQPQLAEIAALKDKQALSAYLGKYLRADVG